MQRNSVDFVYQNEIYSIDINLFNRHSDYFSIEENIKRDLIYFVNEFDPQLQHSKETINAFIKFIQTSEVDITHTNAFSLHFLSHKFHLGSLISKTREFIAKEENEEKLLEEIFSYSPDLYAEQEDFITTKFIHIINDDRLLILSIPQLYRIISKFLHEIDEYEYIEKEDEILNFLIKVIEKKGAMILVSLFNFSKKGRKHFYKKLLNIGETIEIGYIEKNLIQSIIEEEEEKKKLKEDYEMKFQNLYKNIEIKINEILEQHSKDKEEILKEMKKQEQYLKTIIIDTNDFYSNPTYEMFNKLKSETQKMIISNMKNKYKDNQLIDNIYNLMNYLSKVQQKSKYQFENIQFIYIQYKDNKESFSPNDKIEKIIIPSTMIQILISESSINETEFINLINNFEEIYTSIQYPSPEYQQIIDNIIKKKELKLKKEIIIKKIIETENQFQHNEYIDSIIIEPPNEIILGGFKQGYFEFCTGLKNIVIPDSVTRICGRSFYSCCKLQAIHIPESVNIIESGAFGECSSLTEIIIPTSVSFISDYLFQNCSLLKSITIPQSVVSIGNYSFSGCTSLTNITIPSTVQNIGAKCFEKFFGLKRVEIDLFHTSIEKNTFENRLSLIDIITRINTSEKTLSPSKESSIIMEF